MSDDDDDGLMLNLAPRAPPQPKPPKQQQTKRAQQGSAAGAPSPARPQPIGGDRARTRNDAHARVNSGKAAHGDGGTQRSPAQRERARHAASAGEGEAPVPRGPPPPKSSSLFSSNPDIPTLAAPAPTPKRKRGATPLSATSFSELGLDEALAAHMAGPMGLSAMTRVQRLAIPHVLDGSDVMVRSETGTGKTLTYLVPIVQSLVSRGERVSRADGPYAVILAPTRELATQILEVAQALLRPFHWIVPGAVMGGEKKKSEKARLRKGVNVLVATPGRLLDHLENTERLSTARLQWLVLDEADRLTDMGFEREVSAVVALLDKAARRSGQPRQNLLLSATLREGVRRLAGVTLKEPLVVDAGTEEVQRLAMPPAEANPGEKAGAGASAEGAENGAPQAKGKKRGAEDGLEADAKRAKKGAANEEADGGQYATPAHLEQRYVIVPAKLRLVSLVSFLRRQTRASGRKAVVFLSTCEAVDFHYYTLGGGCPPAGAGGKGHSRSGGDGGDGNDGEKRAASEPLLPGCACYRLHGSMVQRDRQEAWRGFCAAGSAVLLCTDVAARGLDFPAVDWIVQYTVPPDAADYVHRVGRTARIGREGHALLFLMPSESAYVSVLAMHGLAATPMDYAELLEAPGGRPKHSKRAKVDEEQGGEGEGGKKEFKLSHDAEAAATAIQLEAERRVLEEKEMAALARGAFLSFVRGYATYPSAMKSVGFMVSALHLGHMAKSFALREAPRELQKRSNPQAKKGPTGRVSKATAKAQLQERKREKHATAERSAQHEDVDGNISYRRGQGAKAGAAGGASPAGRNKRKLMDEFGNDVVDGPLTKRRKGAKGKR